MNAFNGMQEIHSEHWGVRISTEDVRREPMCSVNIAACGEDKFRACTSQRLPRLNGLNFERDHVCGNFG